MNKKAFTLAEVLITLGIVGIIAAITMPQISRYYRSKVLESQLKEVYSTLSQAIDSYYAETGTMFNSFGSDAYGIQRKAALMKYIKYSKDCGYRVLDGQCTLKGEDTTPYLNLTGTSTGPNFFLGQQTGQFITNKGALITVSAGDSISVDINGKENPPNKWGLDVFVFKIDAKTGKLKCPIDERGGHQGDYSCYYPNDNGKSNPSRYNYYANGVGCARMVLSDSNYWRDVRKFL